MKAKDLAALLLQYPDREVGLDDPDRIRVATMNNIKVLTATTIHDKECLVICGSGYREDCNIHQYGVALDPEDNDEMPRRKLQPKIVPPVPKLWPHEVKWIVNSKGELGVMVYGQCFFLYNGLSCQYDSRSLTHQDQPLRYRKVLRNEFGRDGVCRSRLHWNHFSASAIPFGTPEFGKPTGKEGLHITKDWRVVVPESWWRKVPEPMQESPSRRVSTLEEYQSRLVDSVREQPTRTYTITAANWDTLVDDTLHPGHLDNMRMEALIDGERVPSKRFTPPKVYGPSAASWCLTDDPSPFPEATGYLQHDGRWAPTSTEPREWSSLRTLRNAAANFNSNWKDAHPGTDSRQARLALWSRSRVLLMKDDLNHRIVEVPAFVALLILWPDYAFHYAKVDTVHTQVADWNASQMPTNRQACEALDHSIEVRWRSIVDCNGVPPTNVASCALCGFQNRVQSWYEFNNGGDKRNWPYHGCAGCPLYEYDAKECCEGESTYGRWNAAPYHYPEKRALAQDMRNLLVKVRVHFFGRNGT